MVEDGTSGSGTGISTLLDKIERIYLVILRAAVLVIATVCLVCALWFAIIGLYGASRDAKSVKVAEARVTAEEMAALPAAESGASEAKPADAQAEAKTYYRDFVKRYYAVFRSDFESYRQSTDRPLDESGFDARYVQSRRRLEAISNGDLNLSDDKANLEALLAAMQTASKLPATTDRLKRYKGSTRQKVERVVRRTRTERYCSYYGYYIDACITYDTREVPYSEKRISMELPKGVIAYDDLFGKYQDNFLAKLVARKDENARKAQEKRDEIAIDNIRGGGQLWTALEIAGGFLALMFFFLLIAIERHHRKLTQQLQSGAAREPV